MNKPTITLSIEQYHEIIEVMLDGWSGHRANPRAAIMLMLIADTGARLKDIREMVYNDFYVKNDKMYANIQDNEYCLTEFTEKYIVEYVFPNKEFTLCVTDRCIQKHLKEVCEFLDLKWVGISSFKKLYCALNHYKSITPPTNNTYPIKSKSPYGVAGLYSIRCVKNGRIYIGESDNIGNRWDEHKECLMSHTHHSALLQSDYDKYGSSSFVWSVLGEYSNERERKIAESNYIFSLGTIRHGYNTRA